MHRFEGYLPADEFLAQLGIGLGRAALVQNNWEAAESWFSQISKDFPKTDAAPEALYWAGVALYKKQGDHKALAETFRKFQEKYPGSVWAKKASVWAA